MEEYILPDWVSVALHARQPQRHLPAIHAAPELNLTFSPDFPSSPAIDFYLSSNMSADDLVEIDSLEATVIIDNELDPLSTIAPDTVHVTGLMGNIARCARDTHDERGPGCKELRMEDICCSAHGLSILVVCIS